MPALKVKDLDPAYRKNYERGWHASRNCSGLDAADLRGESDAWYDGYLDYAADREKWHMPRCPDHSKCP